jgi:hypothetical protein
MLSDLESNRRSADKMFVVVRMQQNKGKTTKNEPSFPKRIGLKKKMGKPRTSLKPQKMSNEFFKIISETNNYARQQLIESVLPHSP